ncbi:MAG: MFS transporter [Burkholderiales bacterium]|nr:MFS transporter [Burkholderiales bacterium]
MSTTRTALVALAATLAIQIYTSITATAPAVLASMLAGDFGIAPTWIGVFAGLMYAGAMLGSLSGGGFVARYGAIRVSQACVLICATGIAVMAVMPAAAVAALIGAAVGMGIGYGPITVASSELLARTTPQDRMALVFSIKQTGVPAGAAIAGALLPVAALAIGWRVAFIGVAVLGLLVTVAAQPSRRALDLRNPDRKPFSLSAIFAPIRTILGTPSLLELALCGFGFAAVQVCLSSFLVVYLTESLQWSLVAAGLALTFTTFAAVPGRIIWGAIADRTRSAVLVLAGIGIVAAMCGFALALARPAWPTAVVLLVCALYGFSAVGWNGVQLSEVARRAPAGMTAAITGASSFIMFGGVMLGPVAFAALVGVAGFGTGFVACAVVSGVTAAGLLMRARG